MLYLNQEIAYPSGLVVTLPMISEHSRFAQRCVRVLYILGRPIKVLQSTPFVTSQVLCATKQ